MKSTTSSRKTKSACVDCHFLANVLYYPVPEVDDANLYETNYVEVAFNNRERIRKKDYSWFRGALGCYLGCWSEKYADAKERRHEVIVETDRNDCCFFFEYKPTMGFEAAEKMLERMATLGVSEQSNKTETVAYDWSINNTKEVYCNGKYITKLPNLQFKLFECLYKKQGKYVKNETLEKCWKNKKPDYVNFLSTEMSKIGSKLKRGLEENNIKIDGDVIERKKENRRNIAYKLVTKS